jgi:Ras-related protein Rab-6A
MNFNRPVSMAVSPTDEPPIPIDNSLILRSSTNSANKDSANWPRYKVVLLGAVAVGKTALANRAMTGQFATDYVATVGSNRLLGEFSHPTSQCVFELWDTAGEERFRSLTPLYVRDSEGAILVFDLTNLDSFEQLPIWLDIVREASPDAHIVIFGNKSDLIGERVVPVEKANEFADDNRALLIEGSVKTGQNVKSAFQAMAMLAGSTSIVKHEKRALLLAGNPPKKDKCC